jgi:hypothetical protein
MKKEVGPRYQIGDDRLSDSFKHGSGSDPFGLASLYSAPAQSRSRLRFRLARRISSPNNIKTYNWIGTLIQSQSQAGIRSIRRRDQRQCQCMAL